MVLSNDISKEMQFYLLSYTKLHPFEFIIEFEGWMNPLTYK
jgi:hypothetical protein